MGGSSRTVKIRWILTMTKNILFTWDVLLNQSFALPLTSDQLHSRKGIKLAGDLPSGLLKISLGDWHGNRDTGLFAQPL